MLLQFNSTERIYARLPHLTPPKMTCLPLTTTESNPKTVNPLCLFSQNTKKTNLRRIRRLPLLAWDLYNKRLHWLLLPVSAQTSCQLSMAFRLSSSRGKDSGISVVLENPNGRISDVLGPAGTQNKYDANDGLDDATVPGSDC